MQTPGYSYIAKENDLLQVLDENGNITNQTATKKEVHAKKLWHNEAALFIINKEGKLLLQLRSQNVNFNKGKWGMVACHPTAGQKLGEGIIEKAKEEIGLNLNIKDFKFLVSFKREQTSENKFTYFYFLKSDIKNSDIKLNSFLATEYRWFDINELKAMLMNEDESIVFVNNSMYQTIFSKLEKLIKGKETDKPLAQNEFILMDTRDGCTFPSVLYRPAKKTNKCVVFIHGTAANFYKQAFYDDIISELTYNGFAFLAAGNRGMDIQINFYKTDENGKAKSYKGGALYENFEDSFYDVEAAVNTAKQKGYTDIILMGGSLGGLKVLNYIQNNKEIGKIVLMSPVDMITRFKARVGEKYQELIDKAKLLVIAERSDELITDEYSALKVSTLFVPNGKGDILDFESRHTPSRIINYDKKIFAIMGTRDHVHGLWSLDYIVDKLKAQFKNAEFSYSIVRNADHNFKKYEKEFAAQLISGIKELK